MVVEVVEAELDVPFSTLAKLEGDRGAEDLVPGRVLDRSGPGPIARAEGQLLDPRQGGGIGGG